MPRSTLPFALLLLLPSFAAAQGGPPPSAVRVSEVARERIQERRRVTGEVRSHRRARIAAQEPGWVVEVFVREGQAVAVGDLLARVDSTKLELDLARQVAEVARVSEVVEERRTAAERAAMDLEALKALADRGAANPKELRDAEFDRRAAAAREKQAEHELAGLQAAAKLLRERIDDTEIRAPWAGTVISRFTEAGEWLEVGAEVVELLSTGELEAWLLVSQRYYGALETEGAGLELHVDATGEEIGIEEFRVVPLVDTRGRTFNVVARLSANPSLAAGMSVTAWVPTGAAAERLLVPRSAILRNDVGPYVYVAMPGGEGKPATAMLVPISVTYSIGDRAVVEGGALSEGAQVVTEGNERLFPTAPILPMPAAPETGGAGR